MTVSRSQNQVRWLAAGAVLLGAGAYAGTLVARPAGYSGTDPGQIRELAGRLESQQVVTPVSLEVPPAGPAPAPAAEPQPAPRPVSRTAVRVPGPRVGRLPVLPPATGAPEPATAPLPAPAPVSPVKSIALMGVTQQDSAETAWLVNVDTRERELASEGESAFGLTVKEIGPESVLVTHDGQDYTLSLGEKQIPMVEAPQAMAAEATGFGAVGMGRGGRRGNRGQGMAQGGGGGFSGRGGRNRGNWGGAMSFGAGGMGASASVGSGGFNGNRGGNRGMSNNSFGGRQGGFSGGRQGGVSGGGGFGGFNGAGQRNGGSTSQFAAGAGGSTANPQTARRRGVSVSGGGMQRSAGAATDVQAIVNPQTQRRTGTSSGPAFGETQQGGQGRAARTNR